MTRERWEDSMAVNTAWGAVERDPSRANVLALCEAVAACVDASPSETTGGEVKNPFQCKECGGSVIRGDHHAACHSKGRVTRLTLDGVVFRAEEAGEADPLFSGPLVPPRMLV